MNYNINHNHSKPQPRPHSQMQTLTCALAQASAFRDENKAPSEFGCSSTPSPDMTPPATVLVSYIVWI